MLGVNLGRKVQRYIRGNIELLQSEKRCVDFLKFLLKIGLKIILKELLSVIGAPRKENANT